MKQLRVVRRDAFRRDLIEQFHIIAEDQPAAAEKFARCVDELIRDLAAFPHAGRQWEPTDDRLHGVRVRCVKGFQVLVFYMVLDDCILMLRALHGARGDLLEILSGELGPMDD